MATVDEPFVKPGGFVIETCPRCTELEAQIEILRLEKAQLEKDNESLLDNIGRSIVGNTKALIKALHWKEVAKLISLRKSNGNKEETGS